ncbi:hypothetical protein WT26_30120 [Burkholderia cepacia]|uniref:Uncharacterized protein n=2 Tax=Burkholderia cepacia complex TaxID=87882 RepID=A0A1B4Q1J4_BURCE|nr:hypothetical protein WT26_30120 [Burkholderia cepacia]AOK26835.1 hypothetical protein WK67_29985 [Burkholderia ubonensis]
MWVIDLHSEYVDDIKAMGDIAVHRMRSVSGETWSPDGRPIGVAANSSSSVSADSCAVGLCALLVV